MKKLQITVLFVTIGFGAAWVGAQEGQRPHHAWTPDAEEKGFFPPPPHHHGHRPPPSPLMIAIDVNRDGKLDAQEIANASKLLQQLDKNGDGELTFEELRPPFPQPEEDEWGPEDERPDGDAEGPPPCHPPL